jgi:serine/threonine-protein kinase
MDATSTDLPEKIGRYRPTAEIGRGGMGVVYRAEDPELHRPVAVKVILFPPGVDGAMRAELEARFRREARAAARIRHPGVVTVHDVGRDGDYLFLVMELIDGESLAERLRRGPRPTRAEAFTIAARVAQALAAAHAEGVAHRDVTPRNILLARDGGVLVTDFGIARSFGEQATELTRTGVLVGSPSYVAPEQARGQPVDERADVFSLGVVLFEMLTGERPFKSPDVTSVLYQIVYEDPLAREGVRESLGPGSYELLRKCLEKSPENRLPDATTAAREILRLRDEQAGILTESLPPTAVLGMDGNAVRRRARGRRKLPRSMIGAAAALAVLAAVFFWWRPPSLDPEAAGRLADAEAADLPDEIVFTDRPGGGGA